MHIEQVIKQGEGETVEFKSSFKVDAIEKYGSGIARIMSYCLDEGLPQPEFKLIGEGFQVTLFSKLYEKHNGNQLAKGVNEGVNEGVNKLFLVIKENPGKRIPYFTKSMGVPEKTMERWLKILKERHEIEFRGAAKTGGYWVVDNVRNKYN